ncbi:hypothetical protein [Deinococcus kurensis]|nr:hypothetical protein [Deinococcus kurensis]
MTVAPPFGGDLTLAVRIHPGEAAPTLLPGPTLLVLAAALGVTLLVLLTA